MKTRDMLLIAGVIAAPVAAILLADRVPALRGPPAGFRGGSTFPATRVAFRRTPLAVPGEAAHLPQYTHVQVEVDPNLWTVGGPI